MKILDAHVDFSGNLVIVIWKEFDGKGCAVNATTFQYYAPGALFTDSEFRNLPQIIKKDFERAAEIHQYYEDAIRALERQVSEYERFINNLRGKTNSYRNRSEPSLKIRTIYSEPTKDGDVSLGYLLPGFHEMMKQIKRLNERILNYGIQCMRIRFAGRFKALEKYILIHAAIMIAVVAPLVLVEVGRSTIAYKVGTLAYGSKDLMVIGSFTYGAFAPSEMPTLPGPMGKWDQMARYVRGLIDTANNIERLAKGDF